MRTNLICADVVTKRFYKGVFKNKATSTNQVYRSCLKSYRPNLWALP